MPQLERERQLASFAQKCPTHSAMTVKCFLANHSILEASKLEYQNKKATPFS
jgi:hypothetical protein